MSEGDRHRNRRVIEGLTAAGAIAAAALAVGSMLNKEGVKPAPTEVFDGTVSIFREYVDPNTGEITSRVIIREWPDIPHGSSATDNIYWGWPWDNGSIYVTNPLIVDSHDPVDGSRTSGVWIQLPVDGDQKYIAWSPANADLVSALPGGKFIRGGMSPDGSFIGNDNREFKPEELGVVSLDQPYPSS